MENPGRVAPGAWIKPSCGVRLVWNPVGIQCLFERQADGPNRVVKLERALDDAEAGLPRARARFAAAQVDYDRALADLAAAEREFDAAKAARDVAK